MPKQGFSSKGRYLSRCPKLAQTALAEYIFSRTNSRPDKERSNQKPVVRAAAFSQSVAVYGEVNMALRISDLLESRIELASKGWNV